MGRVVERVVERVARAAEAKGDKDRLKEWQEQSPRPGPRLRTSRRGTYRKNFTGFSNFHAFCTSNVIKPTPHAAAYNKLGTRTYRSVPVHHAIFSISLNAMITTCILSFYSTYHYILLVMIINKQLACPLNFEFIRITLQLTLIHCRGIYRGWYMTLYMYAPGGASPWVRHFKMECRKGRGIPLEMPTFRFAVGGILASGMSNF